MSDLTETVQAAKTQAELHTCWRGPQAEMHQLRHLGVRWVEDGGTCTESCL